MKNSEKSSLGFVGAYNEMISDEDSNGDYAVDSNQVFMSVRSGPGLRHPRLLAVSLALLAAALLLVDIGLGIHYSTLKDGHITFDDMIYINDELIKLQDAYKISIESTMEANKQLANEIRRQQLTKWELEHQTKRSRESEDQISKMKTDIGALQSELTMITDGCRRCLPGWILMNSLCYYFPFSATIAVKTWHEAREHCKIHGGDLAVIDSKDKEFAIVKILNNNDKDPSRSIRYKGFWFGLSDVHEEGTWKWLDGRTMFGGYWNDGEPSNGGGNEDCAAVYPRANPFKAWNDAPCSWKLKWICEMIPKPNI